MKKVRLVSQEKEILEVDQDVASKSGFLKDIVETVEEIPLPNVKFQVLKKVMEYCERHRNDTPPEIEKPLKTSNLYELVDEYDAKFIDLENLEEIYEIIVAANYLDIRSLLDLGCAKVASQIKGKSPEEVRKVFNIENDFNAEEEAFIREKNKWADDSD